MSSAIQVRLFSGTTTPMVLGSLATPLENGLLGFGGDEERTVEVVPLPRGNTPDVFPRGNATEGIQFRIQRLHPNLSVALLYWCKHPSTVSRELVDVEVRQASAVAWLNGSAVKSVRRTERQGGGLTTIFEYNFVGGAWASQRINPPS